MHRLIFLLWCLLFTTLMLFASNIEIKSIDYLKKKNIFVFNKCDLFSVQSFIFPLNIVLSHKKLWRDFNSILSVEAKRVDFFMKYCRLWCSCDWNLMEYHFHILATNWEKFFFIWIQWRTKSLQSVWMRGNYILTDWQIDCLSVFWY